MHPTTPNEPWITVAFMGNKVVVDQFGGRYRVRRDTAVLEEFDDFDKAKDMAYEFLKAQSALKGRR